MYGKARAAQIGTIILIITLWNDKVNFGEITSHFLLKAFSSRSGGKSPNLQLFTLFENTKNKNLFCFFTFTLHTVGMQRCQSNILGMRTGGMSKWMSSLCLIG